MMNREKLKPIVTGIIKHIPGIKRFLPTRTGGTIESRYCYSVWLRHLINWNTYYRNRLPESVAELGPGDSLGVGLCSLLTGSKSLYSLDMIKYWDTKRNLKIFNELITLLKNKTNIPDNLEYPKIKPILKSYKFPSNILSDELLSKTLDDNRLNNIKNELNDIDNPNNTFLKYYIPWNQSGIIRDYSIDLIFSQTVLQHVEDLEHTYKSMRNWIKPKGLMSHTIDFKSMGCTKSWDGHRAFSDVEWKIVKGGKLFLINREPISKHIELLTKFGFKILTKIPNKIKNQLNRNQYSNRFKYLSDDDLITSGVYILAIKE